MLRDEAAKKSIERLNPGLEDVYYGSMASK